MSNGALVPILVALIGALGLVLVSVIPLMVSTRRHAKQANEAVNCRPDGSPRIAEQVDTVLAELCDFRYSMLGEVRDLRKEQASLAVLLGHHIAEHGSP